MDTRKGVLAQIITEPASRKPSPIRRPCLPIPVWWVLPKRSSRARWLPLDEAVDMIARGETICAASIVNVYWALTPIWLVVGKGTALSLGDAASFLRGDATFLRAARGLGGAANGRRRGSGVAQ